MIYEQQGEDIDKSKPTSAGFVKFIVVMKVIDDRIKENMVQGEKRYGENRNYLSSELIYALI